MSNGIDKAIRLGITFDIDVRVNGSPLWAGADETGERASESGASEAGPRQPIINTDYTNRTGFDAGFIGVSTPLPTLTDVSVAAPLLAAHGSGHILRYEHFSVVMHAARRLAIYTASNVDYNPTAKTPEPGRNYSRDGLNGFGPNVRGEIWMLDRRISADHQLDNTFYDRDRQAFDKGHLVRREDVCFGGSYAQVRRANGDTFHSTNCSPQRKNFNQSNESGIWGQLEDFIKAQADVERLNLFAGPILADDDRVFDGQDRNGPISVRIPRRFWKIVCANAGGELQVFAFLLSQRVEDVTAAEFAVTNAWRQRMVALSEVEELTGLTFDQSFHAADQRA